MAVLGEGADHFHIGIGCGVGSVDDAVGRLATRHEEEGGADAFGAGDLSGNVRPQPKLFQRGLAILAGGDGIHGSHGQSPVAEKTGEVETRLDLDSRGVRLAGDEDDAIAEQVGARVGLDQLLVGEIIHPGKIGRDEHIGGRALLDLFRQRRTRRIGHDRFLAGLLEPFAVDRIERILEARRCEHGDLLRRLGRCKGRSRQDHAERQ